MPVVQKHRPADPRKTKLDLEGDLGRCVNTVHIALPWITHIRRYCCQKVKDRQHLDCKNMSVTKFNQVSNVLNILLPLPPAQHHLETLRIKSRADPSGAWQLSRSARNSQITSFRHLQTFSLQAGYHCPPPKWILSALGFVELQYCGYVDAPKCGREKRRQVYLR